MKDEQLLRAMFAAAVAAADPAEAVRRALPSPPAGGRIVVVGAGKAAAAMAQAVDEEYSADVTGLVVVPYGHVLACRRIEVVEAAHPVPDEAGVKAAARILELVSGLGREDLVIALFSGGGSALLCSPKPGLSLASKQEINAALLESGAPIAEMNLVRKQLSRVKGGRLAAAAHPARVLTLLVSDVPGDDPSVIASGPTIPDAGRPEHAIAILDQRGIRVPPEVRAAILDGNDCLPLADPRLSRNSTTVVAGPQRSLEVAADLARSQGVRALILGDSIEGESREVARVMAAVAKQVRAHGQPVPPPCVLLSGGETTVTVRGTGRGGRNVEYGLALAIALDGLSGASAIACDTDGVDGVEPVAGAVIDASTLARARRLGLLPEAFLANNDAHSFFAALGDQVVTGPTLTNVNDFRALLVR